MGRPRHRHGPHALIAAVRREHRARGDEVRRVGAAGHEHRRARRLRERLGAHVARGRARARDRLWGVRLDTSGQLVDRSLWDEMGDFDPRGVNERLVRKVRDALDADGFERVQDRRLRRVHGRPDPRVRAAGVPVDAYGIGSSLIRGENDFTGDIVLTDGRPSAKVGPPLPTEPAARARSPRALAFRATAGARHQTCPTRYIYPAVRAAMPVTEPERRAGEFRRSARIDRPPKMRRRTGKPLIGRSPSRSCSMSRLSAATDEAGAQRIVGSRSRRR